MGMEICRRQVKRSMITIVKLGPGNTGAGIGKYSFVNREIKNLYQLLEQVLVTFSRKSHIFRKRVRKVVINEK
jgi:hypothetical protein